MRSQLAAADEPPEDDDGQPLEGGARQGHGALPYRVEILEETGAFVEEVIALTRNRSIGWAAFMAATNQFPRRAIVFRDEFGEISRWDPTKH